MNKSWIVVLVFSLTAISGLININFQHNIHLPSEIGSLEIVNSYKTVSLIPPFVHTHYDIRMNDEIKGINSVKGILKALQEAKTGDEVIFHLAGYGGNTDTTYMLINNIRNTKADVTMSIEGPIYSGHAYLAFGVNKKIVIDPYALVMFHTSSLVNLDCTQQDGVDRGVSNVEHCDSFKTANMVVITKLILNVTILTNEEKLSIMFGHDVYLTPEEVNKRLGN